MPRPEPKPPFERTGPDKTPISELTTMKLERWRVMLFKPGGYGERFPIQAALILNGIEHGVDIEFAGDRSAVRIGRNLPVSLEDVPKVTAIIDKDVAAKKKAGPFPHPPFPNFVVAPIGCVPKKGGKVRVIHHLSFPHHGDSVNASIVEEGFSLSGFGHAARAVVAAGRGCCLVKLDVEAAFKQVPVRPEDWPLLGFSWQGKYYYERVLPFGLKSSCRLWELYAAALHFFFERELGVEVVIRYIDDFLFVVQSTAEAERFKLAALALCAGLGIPMADDKTEGPTTCLTFLGIELDTIKLEARLPAGKLADLLQLTEVWRSKSTASVKELQSLTGMLSFACAVVRPGRFYLRRIINHQVRVAAIAHSRMAQYPLTDAVRADVAWWAEFIVQWNGKSLLYERDWNDSIAIELTSDACLSGYGAMYKSEWFAERWTGAQLAAAMRKKRVSMPFLEMFALVQAAAVWGPSWSRKKITFRCDCDPVVKAITKCSSRIPGMMFLLRHLSTLACRFGFDFRCTHIAGVYNVAADILSRDGDCPQFRALFPNAAPLPLLFDPLPLPPAEE